MQIWNWEKTEKLLKAYDFPLLETFFCSTKEEARGYAEKLGYPVVLKVFSPLIVHRTELGGVKFDINNELDLEKAWGDLESSFSFKEGDGILFQKKAKGIEFSLGMKKDQSFGPVLMFGLGGIFIELLKDVSFRVAPIFLSEALKMVNDIKAQAVFDDFRGHGKIDKKQLAEIILKLSKLSIGHPEIETIDFNPITFEQGRFSIVDVKII